MEIENFNFEKYFSYEYGSARWADTDEIIKNAPTIKRINIADEDCPGSGIPLISDGRIAYVDNSDTHSLIFGSTGSKKTRLFGMPLINFFGLAGESFIATDPKGELYDRTSGLVAAKGYKIVVLNFRDLYQSDFWNPFALPYELYHGGKKDEAISLLNDFINALADLQIKSAKDPYWILMGCSMALAYVLFFIDTATSAEANITNFVDFFASKSSENELEELSRCVAAGSVASINFNGILRLKGTTTTFNCVASEVTSMFNPFIIRKSLCQVLSNSSFDVRDIGKEKTAIYIIIPDEKTTLHFLVTAFVKQTYEALIQEAQQQKDKKLPVRVNILLDEFGNIPRISDMASMITAARSRNIRFFLLVQGMYQMSNKYGKGDAETIKANCDNILYLVSREYDLLKEISSLCGDTYYKDNDGNLKTRALISISELQRFSKERGETLIIHGRNYPLVTELPDIDQYNFKSYPQVSSNNNTLPQIVRYDANKVFYEIRNGKRPIPFSDEVSDETRYFEGQPARSNDDLLWGNPSLKPANDDDWNW